jgi:hypothetical protein
MPASRSLIKKWVFKNMLEQEETYAIVVIA